MIRLPPTPTQARCLEAIRSFSARTGYAPTYAELACMMYPEKLGGCSTNAISDLLIALKAKGLVTWTRNKAGTLRVTGGMDDDRRTRWLELGELVPSHHFDAVCKAVKQSIRGMNPGRAAHASILAKILWDRDDGLKFRLDLAELLERTPAENIPAIQQYALNGGERPPELQQLVGGGLG